MKLTQKAQDLFYDLIVNGTLNDLGYTESYYWVFLEYVELHMQGKS